MCSVDNTKRDWVVIIPFSNVYHSGIMYNKYLKNHVFTYFNAFFGYKYLINFILLKKKIREKKIAI